MAIFCRQFTSRSSGAAAEPDLDPAPIDRQAFAALYQGYFDPIYRYCYARLGSQERAEDAAHQVFVRALEAFDRYQENGRARQWLFAIAHNVVTNEVLRRAATPLDRAGDLPDPTASPESLALEAGDRQALRQAVARLRPSAVPRLRNRSLRSSSLRSPWTICPPIPA